MNFGEAIEALKKGQAVARSGWNGKYLWLNKGSVPADRLLVHGGGFTESVKDDLFENGDMGTITRLPNINMRTATGSTVTGWLASQTDMLSEDWNVLPQAN